MRDSVKNKINWKIIIASLIVVVLTPFAAKLGGEAMGFLTTPKQLRAINERIKTDSAFAVQQLKDSCRAYRWIMRSQRERISETENQIKTINLKLKIK